MRMWVRTSEKQTAKYFFSNYRTFTISIESQWSLLDQFTSLLKKWFQEWQVWTGTNISFPGYSIVSSICVVLPLWPHPSCGVLNTKSFTRYASICYHSFPAVQIRPTHVQALFTRNSSSTSIFKSFRWIVATTIKICTTFFLFRWISE